MAGEPPPSSVPESSFPLLSPLSPRRQDDPQVTGVTGSSTTATGSGTGCRQICSWKLGGGWRLHLHDPGGSSCPFLPRRRSSRLLAGLDAAASTPVASSSFPAALLGCWRAGRRR
ncbi:hypothetical protein GUJ93_ZPchr0012g21614 [Zizania palustris]|uniref:Uncharacterized protein n=1 Tax=Zizania palustris TaxID=103762 RepID=A0A8J5WTP2_ZIZPA|nr:hypothetical protein GUJ93_ZPchr0012g21614 [Zizania palustris]